MLSHKNGKSFAVIKKNNKIKEVKIHDDSNKNKKKYVFDESKLDHLDQFQLDNLKYALIKKDISLLADSELKKYYNKIMNNGDLGKHISGCDAVRILPTEDKNQRDSIMICGPSGAGKSVFVSQFMDEYIHKYPERNIVLFSMKPEDKALDRYKPMRIPLDEDLVDDPVKLNELENSLVIFDDIDQITNKDVQNAVWNLRDRILEVGRSKGISICTVSHQVSNYRATRVCLNESDYVVIFPKSGGRYQINYFLKTYCGFDKDQINLIMSLPTRWVIVKKTYPMCVMYQNGIYIP